MVANIEAYSTPITPPPMTAMVCGSRSMPRMSSLVSTTPSRDSVGGGAGRVPQAMSTVPAVSVRWPRSDSTQRVCGSTKLA